MFLWLGRVRAPLFMHLKRERRRTCTFDLAEVGSEPYPLCSIRCAKTSGGRADGQHVVSLKAVWLRYIINWRGNDMHSAVCSGNCSRRTRATSRPAADFLAFGRRQKRIG